MEPLFNPKPKAQAFLGEFTSFGRNAHASGLRLNDAETTQMPDSFNPKPEAQAFLGEFTSFGRNAHAFGLRLNVTVMAIILPPRCIHD